MKKTLFLLVTIFCVIVSSCSQFFQGKVDMDLTEGASTSIFDVFKTDEVITSLDAPVEMNISKGLYSKQIEVSWSAVKYADSYCLERAVVTETDENGNPILPSEADFAPLPGTDIYYKTSYTDIILSEGETYKSDKFAKFYFYRVLAQNLSAGYEKSGYYPDYEPKAVEGKEDKVVLADPKLYGCLFKPPYSIEADKGKSTEGINIRWAKVDYATKYQIYRCETEDGYYYPLATVYGNDLSYQDLIAERYQGTEFFYKICAQNAIGSISVYSASAMGYALQHGAPLPPDNVRVVDGFANSISSLKVQWDEVDTSAVDADEITYTLYRNTSVDSVYTLVKSNIPTNETSYVDTKVEPGIYYYYYLQTVAKKTGVEEAVKSAFSESGMDSEKPAYGFLLTAPTSIEVEDGSSENKAKILWQPAINVLYDGETPVEFTYKIYFGDEQDGSFANDIGTIEVKTDETTGKRYAEVDKKNFYLLKTINENGEDKESKNSVVVAPTPSKPRNIKASKTIGITTAQELFAKHGSALTEEQWKYGKNEVYPVVITWDAPVKADGKPDNVSGYNIYRSTSPDTGFKKINEDAVIPATQTCYLDAFDSAKSATYYYYKVYSLNSLGQGTKSNDPMNDPMHDSRGYGAITRDQWFREYNKSVASSQKKLTLMHKKNNWDKLGSETKDGTISGTVGYKSAIAGSGAEIEMPYTNYADNYIGADYKQGIMFVLNGNTDTSANISANGNMSGTVNCYSYTLDLTGSVPDKTFEKLSADDKSKILATKDKSYLVGMYPGYAIYNKLEIKGGAAGDGYYLVQTYEIEGGSDGNYGKVILSEDKVNWLVGEEIRK